MAVQIPCPECGAILKLPDRTLLGRKGKCPKCGHRFVLSEPDEVELELAPSHVEEPLKPTAVRRVNDESAAATPVLAPSAAPLASDAVALPDLASIPSLPAGTERLNRRRSRKKRTEIVVGGIVALLLVASLASSIAFLRTQPSPASSSQVAVPSQNIDYENERVRLERQAALIAADRPTQGDPITLEYIPAGASILVHLRPAELWAPGSPGEELRFCLGDRFSSWLQTNIERYCLLPPSDVREVTIAVSLGARGSPPTISSVVRPVTPLKTSELIQKFDGSQESFGGIDLFVGAERAYVIGRELDEEKRPTLFATTSTENAQSLAESVVTPSITSDDIEQLLEHTDRQRHFTVVFRPEDLEIHHEALAAPDLQPGWNAILDRFGKDVAAAIWSGHIEKQTFNSELLVRNAPDVTPPQLAKTLRRQLDRAPKDLVAAVEKMQPSYVGDRKLIGRFPAMTHVFALATVEGIDDRLVVLQTELPERAGPNLALAGLLTWNQASQTDFDAKTSPQETEVKPTGSIADRLKLPIEIDFRRTPLEEAFAYIGNETNVSFEVDGDALKLAGYTRNMPQVFSLGKVPAERGVAQILSAYDKMTVVIDDANQKAIVTTKAVAEEKGLTSATFSAE